MKNKYYVIFSVLFLLLSLVGAIYLSFQNADTRNRAAIDPGTCMCTKDGQSIKGSCNTNGSGGCICPDGYNTGANKCDEKAGDTPPAGNDYQSCTRNGGYWCTPRTCGAFCISGNSTTCDQEILIRCKEYPQRSGTYSTTNTDGIHIYKCSCTQGILYFDKPGVCNFPVGGGIAQNDQVSSNGGDTYIGYNGAENDGLCHIADFTPVTSNAPSGTKYGYWCPGKFDNLGDGCHEQPIPANFNPNCFCGTIQIDTTGQGFTEKTMKCGCKTDTPNNTPVPPTPTPTPPKTNSPTPTRPISSPTPTPTGILSPTPTTPVITDTPTPTPTIGYLGCGYTPCDNTGKICNSGLSCVTADNSNQYCSKPELTEQCKVNPGYTGCCTVSSTQSPSPTRIVLPISGVNFPVQALTIIGGITTLLGFLILL